MRHITARHCAVCFFKQTVDGDIISCQCLGRGGKIDGRDSPLVSEHCELIEISADGFQLVKRWLQLVDLIDRLALCRHQEILSLCHSRALDRFENFISLGFTCPKGYFLIAQTTALLGVVVLIFYNCSSLSPNDIGIDFLIESFFAYFLFKESEWGLGGFAPDKLCLGEAPPRAVGVQTLCLPRFRGCPVRLSALIK